MEQTGREFQVFAKPAGAMCNLRCTYCYYINNQGNPGRLNARLMSDRVLELFVKQNIEASPGRNVTFSWHGGEPLAAGIGFYRKAVRLQKKYAQPGMLILNGIQTNGTLLNDEWAGFLSDEGFFTGISIDGPPEFHDAFRRTPGGKGTFKEAVAGYRLLKRYNVQAEILCVVSSVNARFPLEVYGFLKELGARFITFLPLVEPDPSDPAGVNRASVGALEFGTFLSEIFDEWRREDIGNVKVQIFEEALRCAFGQEHTLCIFRERCGGVPVLEHDGSFYSCDHYVDTNHLVGNITAGSIAEFLDSERQKAFGDRKKLLPPVCLECPVLEMCNGECPKNRIKKTPDGRYDLNYLCEGYKHFFTRCRPFIDTVRTAWMNPG